MLTRAHAAALAAAWVLLLWHLRRSRAGSLAAGRAARRVRRPSYDARPAELRLVFSEPVEPRFTGVRVTDGEGREVPVAAGATDAADAHVWVVPLSSPLTEGVYTVAWHAMSAADGHNTVGFFTFGVGTEVLRTRSRQRHRTRGPARGSRHRPGGRRGGRASGRIPGAHARPRTVRLCVRGPPSVLPIPVVGLSRRGRHRTRLVGGGANEPHARRRPLGHARNGPGRRPPGGRPGRAVVLGLVAAGGLGADVVGYLAGTRSGLLIVGRLGVAFAGAATIYAFRRAGRTAPAVAAGGVAGLAGLLLLVEGGHAAAFASPAPVAVMVVHLGAVSVWLAGVVALAWLALAGERREVLRATVPRFSALALVSVALIGLTGAAATWAETRELLPFGTPYGVALAAKLILFAARPRAGGVELPRRRQGPADARPPPASPARRGGRRGDGPARGRQPRQRVAARPGAGRRGRTGAEHRGRRPSRSISTCRRAGPA